MKTSQKYFVVTALLLLVMAPAMAQVTVVEGVTGQGAQYRFKVPDDWNGEVMVYARGYFFPSSDPGYDEWSFLDDLVDLGYAVAESTYSETGLTVKEGIQQTHQLRGLFRAEFGKPIRTWVSGGSMGGLITIALAETYPSQYDGALSLCGLYDGSLATINQIWGLRPVFDYYYPGVLPGDLLNVDDDYDFLGVGIPAVVGAILGDPKGALEIWGIDQLYINADDFSELLDNIIFRLYFQMDGTNDMIARSQGHNPVDNQDLQYTGSSDDPALNAGVGRFMSKRDAVNFYLHNYETTGRLRIPVLTLHNMRDPILPVEQRDAFAAKVAARNASQYLDQQLVDGFGHCNFTNAEVVAAFQDLVAWVETGVAP